MLSKDDPPITHLFFAYDFIIFREVEMNVILECLDLFCASSVEKVNSTKSRLFCSKKVNFNVAF